MDLKNHIFGMPALTAEDAEAIRVVRNSCRTFMTRDQTEISPEQQQRWFATLGVGGGVYPYMFCELDSPNNVVGYGLIVCGLTRADQDKTKVQLSGGLLPSHRGRGLGAAVFGHMIVCTKRRSPKPVQFELEVLSRNDNARKLYQNLGFVQYQKEMRDVGLVLSMRRG